MAMAERPRRRRKRLKKNNLKERKGIFELIQLGFNDFCFLVYALDVLCAVHYTMESKKIKNYENNLACAKLYKKKIVFY